jgi:hypothetical protein
VDDPDTGITMVTFTTQPGLETYTDNINVPITGRKGALYGNHRAISWKHKGRPIHPIT